jgi:hypothetical protein
MAAHCVNWNMGTHHWLDVEQKLGREAISHRAGVAPDAVSDGLRFWSPHRLLAQ